MQREVGHLVMDWLPFVSHQCRQQVRFQQISDSAVWWLLRWHSIESSDLTHLVARVVTAMAWMVVVSEEVLSLGLVSMEQPFG